MKQKVKTTVASGDISAFGKIKNWFKFYARGLYYKFDEHHIFLYASGLTFSIVLCIIPFILILFSYLGSVLESQEVLFQINLFIDELIPFTAYTENIRNIILERVEEFISYKTIAGIIGGVGLFFTCSGLFSTMRTILNEIFEIQKDKSLLVAKLRDFGMVILIIVFFAFTILINPLFQISKEVINKFVIFNIDLSAAQNLFVNFIFFCLTFVFFYTVYGLIPYEKLNKKVYFVSALWATILLESSKYVFSYYVTNIVNYGRIYGGFAFIIVSALWLYVSSIIFITAAVIGQLFREKKSLLKTSKRHLISVHGVYLPLYKKIVKKNR